MRKTVVAVALLALLLGAAAPALAQRTTADIRGRVTDADGAVLPGATVTAQNVDTGLARSTVTNSAGVYTLANLPVGNYRVQVELQGFKTFIVEGVELNVADVREINAGLELGDVTEEVVVIAARVPVETISGEVANVIEGVQARELPLNGRNFVQLTQLMPGVSSPDSLNTKDKGLMSGVDMSISGSGVTTNLFTVDGSYNNDVGSNRTILIYPSLESIEEFKIHRNSYGAEFGGASGGLINVVTKGGTNEYHGSAVFSMRDDALNSPNFFLERADKEKEKLSRQDIAYSFGGPIVRDRLHFFWSQEWNIEDRGIVRTAFVPTAAQKRGDFSGPGVPGCSPPVPTDPLTGQPFPGNVIPPDRLSEAGLAFLQLYPDPNTTPSAGSCINWIDATPTPINWRQENIRVDYAHSDTTSLMVRFTHDSWVNGEEGSPSAFNSLWGDDPFPTVDSKWDQPARSLVAQLNSEIGESGNNSLTFSYSGNRIDITRAGTNPALNAQITSAIPTIFSDKTTGDNISHPVFWGGQGFQPLWNIAPWNNVHDLFVLKEDYSQVFGEHYVKAGAYFGHFAKDEMIGGSSSFEQTQLWGAAGVNGWGATTGNVLADFLLEDMTWGFVENSSAPFPQTRWRDLAFYLNDSWSAADNVTLDLGLRVERLFQPWTTDDDVAIFNPSLFDPALGGDPCNGLLLPPGNDACAEAGFLGGANSDHRSLVDGGFLLSPRIGLAWDLRGDGEWAVRAGLGRFYLRDRINSILGFAGNPPFIQSAFGIRKLDDAEEPCAFCFGSAFGVPTQGAQLEYDNPHNWQWNVSVEHQLRRDTKLEIGYVGSRGVNLSRRADINQVPAGDANGNGVPDRLDYVRSTGNIGAQAGLRPFGAFGNGTIVFWMQDGESSYHALQAQLVSRFGRGNFFQLAYTLSRLYANDPLTDSGGGVFPGMVTDLSNQELDWGPAGIHRDHVLTASLVYRLPGLEDSGPVVRNVLGDWQVGTILMAMSGTPLTVFTGNLPGVGGPSGTGFTDNQRPNLVPGADCRASGGPEEQWLNPDAFTMEGLQLGTIGNSPRGVCDGPGFFQVDLSFYKNVRLTDRVEAQFRLEVFNVLDRTNFFGVDTNMNPSSVTLDAPVGQATQIVSHNVSPTFGRAFAVRDPRQFQLGVRIVF